MIPECILCNAIEESVGARGRVRERNTELYRSSHFTVMPAVGPLVRGHVLAVSSRHEISLLAMSLDEKRDYEDLVQGFREAFRSDGGMLEAEHGPLDGDFGGSCIVHTHINLIPTLGEMENVLDGVLPLIAEGTSLANIGKPSHPYILVRGRSERIRVFDSTNAPCQMVRRKLCARLGLDEWDWSVEPRNHLITSTIQLWRETYGRA
jgi:diadenosine tetraphosphate (Ap4A) HIT family hydrolase